MGVPPRRSDFETALQRILAGAAAAGQPSVTVNAGELHATVGGYPGPNHRMPLCCQVMKDAMRPSDAVLHSPPSGQGATLTVQYRLPRS
jgi:5-methylcytosine-specific restriction protein A